MKVFWDKHSNSSTSHTFNAQSKDADWTGTSFFLQLLLKLVFLKKVFHLEISEIILCLKKSIKCLLEVGFFILPSKLRRTFQSQWQISKGLIDIPIFSLCQVDITGFSPNLCVQQSLNYHQQPDMTIYGLSSDVLTWRYIFFFLQLL